MELFYDPVKVWALFAALFVAVVVTSVLVFVALRRVATAVARWVAPRAPHLLQIWPVMWLPPVADLNAAWKAYFKGDIPRAMQASRRMLDWFLERTRETSCPWSMVNHAVCVMIAAGLYREALALPARWSASARLRGRNENPREYLLTQVNLAEALYNLGRYGCAGRVLESVRVEAETIADALLNAGVLTQLAWLAVLCNRPAEALELTKNVLPSSLPRAFRCEVSYTRAAALRDLGNTRAARTEVEHGRSLARRASSKRNGLFLLGTIALRENDWLEAIFHFERGASHKYQGQGGDALLLLGDAYRRLDRPSDMQRAYRMVVDRDPQSFAARRARQRLAVTARM